MGADLYIKSIQDIRYARYEKPFLEAVRMRDQHKPPYDQEYQEQVEFYYHKLHSVGYFRDSYNVTNLLRRFGMSYWQNDLRLDANHDLPPSQAKRLLAKLKERESLFEATLDNDQLASEGWESPAEGIEYFRMKYLRLRVFLRMAIRLNETVVWSV